MVDLSRYGISEREIDRRAMDIYVSETNDISAQPPFWETREFWAFISGLGIGMFLGSYLEELMRPKE